MPKIHAREAHHTTAQKICKELLQNRSQNRAESKVKRLPANSGRLSKIIQKFCRNRKARNVNELF